MLKTKRAKDIQLHTHHLNDVIFLKSKNKDLELDNQQLIELLTKREITIEKLHKEKNSLENELVTMVTFIK